MEKMGSDGPWFRLSGDPLIKVKVVGREIVMAADWRPRDLDAEYETAWSFDTGRGLR